MNIDRGAILRSVEQPHLRTGLPDFRAGDTVRVDTRVTEGTRTRIQAFEGVVIAINNSGTRKSFTVRKISFNEGVERVFPFNSPLVADVTVLERGKVRRAKLYYLRELRGRAARIKPDRGRMMRDQQQREADKVTRAEADARAQAEAAAQAAQADAPAETPAPEGSEQA